MLSPSFPSCLEVALITSVPYISMNRVHMVFEISFPCCLVITLITSILHISMSRVYMCFETYFPLCAMLVCPTLCNLDVHPFLWSAGQSVQLSQPRHSPISVVSRLAGVGSIHVILGQPVGYFIFDVHRASTCGFPPTRAQDIRTLIEPVCVTTSLWQQVPISVVSQNVLTTPGAINQFNSLLGFS